MMAKPRATVCLNCGMDGQQSVSSIFCRPCSEPKPMRILYLSQYFPPEIGATQTRAHEMARGLMRAGHQVTMIAEVAQPSARHHLPDYRGKLYDRRRVGWHRCVRSLGQNIARQELSQSYCLLLLVHDHGDSGGPVADARQIRPDLCNLTTAICGWCCIGHLSYLRRLPMVFEVRDLWPESAVALGELRNQRAIDWATRLEEACYDRAQRIVVITERW